MGQVSKIEWTDATWTPIRARRADGKLGVHCEKVSPACKHCYAEKLNKRNLPAHGTGYDFTIANRSNVQIVVDENLLKHPLQWRKPRKIFVCSQTDLFAEFVTYSMIDQVFSTMASCPQHTFQILTKRPERLLQYMSAFRPSPPKDGFITRGGVRHSDSGEGWPIFSPERWPLPNVWLGVTAEDQIWADQRIPYLLKTPAAKRFVSLEPLLGPVDIKWACSRNPLDIGTGFLLRNMLSPGMDKLRPLDWVIAGGESGPGARPSHPDWFRSLRDQCKSAGVAFYFKQHGEWLHQDQHERSPDFPDVVADSANRSPKDGYPESRVYRWPDGLESYRAGKNNAGRLLDGREWNEFPPATVITKREELL